MLEDEKAIVTVNEKFNDSNALQSFVVNIKRANGEVESLRYAMENLEKYTGKANDWHLAYQGGTVNDASAIRQFEQLEKKATEYSNKLNDLKSKLTGTNFKFSGFENTLTQFRNGEITVNQLSTAFNQLKNSAETSLKSLNSQSSSFNSIQQTQNNMRDLPSMITSLETNMNSLKDKTALANVSVQDLTSTYNSLKAEMDAVGGVVPLTDEWTTKYRELMSTVTALTEQVKTLKKVESSDNSAVKLANQANKIQLSIDTGGYESKVNSLISQTQQWTDEFGNSRISTDALSNALKNLGDASTVLSNNTTVENQKALIAAEKELDIQVQKVANSIKNMNSETMKSSAIDSLRQKYQEFYDKNSASHKIWGKQLKQSILELATGAEISKRRGEELRQELIQIQNAARQAGKLGKSGLQKLFEGFKSFGYWTSSTFIFMKVIQSIKGGLGTVKALDTALVDLKKTTTMTNSELEDFYYASNKVAKQMGVTTEEIINQASAWSRLGFSSEAMATKMAKYSSMFASISPGLDLDSATDGLVSTMKAFSIGLDNADDVVDGIMSKINIIGNSKALNNSDIVDFLTRSSSALASANNSIEESIAMGEAIVEITRDAAGAGQVMKTTSMRIRGYDEELESYTEDLENLKGEIAELTKTAKTPGGISLFTDETKETYKSTYKILEEISGIWNDLTDKNQAQLLEVLAGKRNGQALAALISNFKSAQESMDLMANSAGNAEAEMSVIMDSLDFKLNHLSETSTSVAQNLFKRDDMKTVVDGFTSVMNVIDSLTSKLGLFGSIGIGAGITTFVKNFA